MWAVSPGPGKKRRSKRTGRRSKKLPMLLWGVFFILRVMKKKIVVFTGAGISAESGLKTFRDSDGLWENYNIEDVATPMAWTKNRKLVLDFYNHRRKQVLEAIPNVAHKELVKLEKHFEVHIITQNIDD